MTEQERAKLFADECDRMKLAGVLAIKGSDRDTAQRWAEEAARRALKLLGSGKGGA